MTWVHASETVPGVLLEQAERMAGRDYVRYWREGAWAALSWSAFVHLAQGIAAGLIDGGVMPGDRVAILSENRLEWLLCDLAIQWAGGHTVPVYPTLQPSVVQHIVDDAGVRLVIASSPELAAKLGGRARCVLMEREIAEWSHADVGAEVRWELDRRLRRIRSNDTATVVYTSGTTGLPKGVVLTHANLLTAARASLAVFDIGDTDTVLSFLPYSHVLERVDGVFVPSSVGATIWLARGLDTLTDDIQAARPTVMLGVPRLFDKVYEAVFEQVAHTSRARQALFRWALEVGTRRLHGSTGTGLRVQAGLADRIVLRSLRRLLTGGRLRFFISGGAPLNEKVEEFFWAIGIKILQGWGLTECTSGATSNTETEHRFRTVGRALPGIELKIEADGEILLRGETVTPGYLNNAAATAEVLEDGWLRTGDMGFLAADGFLSITDRKKDLIKTSGGKYIAPLPIEARLESDPLVRSALVVGDGRPYAVALLVPNWDALAAVPEDVRCRLQAVVDSCNRDLASFETIKHFAILDRDFTEELDELTPTLKPKRRVIGQHFADRINALYEEPRRVAS